MKRLAILLVLCMIAFVTRIGAQVSGGHGNLPETMHLCTDHCETLVWMQDHYDGKSDSTGALQSRYTVNQWSQDAIDFTGVPVKQNPLAKIRASFKGTIAPGNGTVSNAKVTVFVNSSPMIKDAAYKLTWDSKPEVAPAVNSAPSSAPAPASAPVSSSGLQAIPSSAPGMIPAPLPSPLAGLPPEAAAYVKELQGADAVSAEGLTARADAAKYNGGEELKAMENAARVKAARIPRRLYECEVWNTPGSEGQKLCSVWEFSNDHFKARWPDGSEATIYPDQFDANNVVLTRVDREIARLLEGATYTGKWNGSSIEGGVVTTAHSNNRSWHGSGTWTATLSPDGSESKVASPPVPVSWADASKLLDLKSMPGVATRGLIAFPYRAIQVHIASGELWLTFVVSSEGEVTRVEETHPGSTVFFLDGAESAIRAWNFAPYVQNGEARAMIVKIHVKFQIGRVEITEQ